MGNEKDTAANSPLSSNDLAFERTILAENRTLMAWIRTAISLISFGFTIYKFFHENVNPSDKILTPRMVGMLMIIIGMFALIWGLVDHRATLMKLRKSNYAVGRSRTAWLAIIVLLFGLILFFAALFRQ